MIERAAVGLVAIACAVWMAVAYTSAHAKTELRAATFAKPDVARAQELADDAGRLTPGVRRLLYLSEVELRAGDARGAAAVGRKAVAQEPDNAEAWLQLSRAARTTDPQLAREAAARVRELVPPVPPP